MKNLLLILVALFLCAGSSWGQITVTIGDGTLASWSEAQTPYNTLQADAQHQILFTKAELSLAGLASGNITALAFNVKTADPDIMHSFTISVQHTTSTYATFINSGWTECYSGDVTTTVGWNTHTFTTPFNWNGINNIIFKICFDSDGSTGSASSIVYLTDNSGFHVAQYGNGDGCSSTGGGYGERRPNVQITGAENLTPTIYVDPNTIDLGYAASGSTAEGQYAISGINLTAGPVVVTAPANFGVSLIDGGPYTASVDVAYTAPTLGSTTVFVQFAPSTPNTVYTGNISNVGGGDSKDVAVSGSSDFFDSYCESTGTDNYWEDITWVEFGSSLDNTSTCKSLVGSQGTATGSAGLYSNFTANTPTNIVRGQSIPISVEISRCDAAIPYNGHTVNVYIDFNQNSLLTDAGEVFTIWTYAFSDTHTINYDIDIPADATLGHTLMRVVCRTAETVVPCGVSNFGETEDYKVNIVDAPTTTTWTGNDDNNWHTAGNWDSGIPTSSTDVIIPAGLTDYPTILTAATCKDITLEDGATLVGQENLTVSGTTKVEKSITAYSAVGNPDGWYAISAPVSAMAIAASDFEPTENVDDLYAFDPAANLWLNYYGGNPAGLFDYFDPATGYLVAYASGNAGTKSFTGAFNSAASYQLNPPNTGSSNWSLIGNPYPSKVSWADVTWADVTSPKAINASGAWIDITELEIGQGIFIYAETGSPSITFELADQSHDAKKKDADNTANIKLRANFGDLSVELLVLTNEDASQAFNWKYDARYLQPFTEIPHLCAFTTDDVRVSKYAFKPSDETSIIPLYFKVNEERQITFEIEDYEKYAGIDKVTLEDTYLNTFTVLTDGKDYSFTASANDDELRFKLHLETSTGISNPQSIDGLDIYTQHNMLYLNSNKLMDLNVQVFNVTGQEVLQRKLQLDGIQQINITANTGWYMVKVTSTEGIQTAKVFVR